MAAEGARALSAALFSSLEATHRHGSTNVALVSLLKRLVTAKADIAGGQHRLQAAIRQALGPPYDRALAGETSAEQELADLAASTATALEALQQHLQAAVQLSSAEDGAALSKLEETAEEEWPGIFEQRDVGRRALVEMLTMQQAGWCAKQTHLEQTIRDWVQPSDQLLAPSLEPQGRCAKAAAPSGTSGLHTWGTAVVSAADRLDALVDEMGAEGRAAWAEARAIASRVFAAGEARKTAAETELAECAVKLRQLRPLMQQQAEVQRRREEAEVLLDKLGVLQAGIKSSQKDLRKEKRKVEDLEDEDELDECHVEIVQAKERLRAAAAKHESLTRQREGLCAAITELAATDSVYDAGWEQGAAGATHLFPELPIRVQRIITPWKPSNAGMSPKGRNRLDVEALLRRDGLLIEGRSMEDYNDEDLPEVMTQATHRKPNVTGRRLRGVGGDGGLVILKEISTAEYKTVKRAVVTAHRLRHKGVVPVECCFVDASRDVVVLHSRFYTGGNMRQWMEGKNRKALLVSAQRIAEAVAMLHSHGTLHRDIKPENIVFDGAGADACPALCDFDLSIDISAHATMATSTFMRGTLLYMPPDSTEPPSPSRDVFALGVTLLDVLVFQGHHTRLPTEPNAGGLPGIKLDVTAAQAGLDPGQPLPALLRKMISPVAAERPSASEVERALVDIVASLDVRECVVCTESSSLGQGLLCNNRRNGGGPGQGDGGEADAHCHFVCDECISGDVQHRQVERITATDQSVRCCIPDCTSAAFQYQEIVKHVTPEAFEAFHTRIEELQQEQQELQLERRVRDAEAAMLLKSQLEIEVHSARRQIEDEIMCASHSFF